MMHYLISSNCSPLRNLENPESEIRAAHAVLEVNGLTDQRSMLQEFAKTTTISLWPGSTGRISTVFFAAILVVFWIFQVKTVVNIAWASLQDDVLGQGFGSVFSPSPFSRRCFRTTAYFSLCTCQIVGDLWGFNISARCLHTIGAQKNPLEQSELNQGSSKLSWVPNLGLSLFGACGFFLGSWCIRIYHFMDPSSFPASCDWAFVTCPAFEKIIRSEGPSPFATASLEIYKL